MKINELSIGNIVKHNGEMLIIKNIFAKSVNLDIAPGTLQVKKWVPVDELEPYPITTTILPRLGLRNFYNRYQIKDITTIFITRRQQQFFLHVGNEYKDLFEVKHVHQLQNIIRHWLGVELKYK